MLLTGESPLQPSAATDGSWTCRTHSIASANPVMGRAGLPRQGLSQRAKCRTPRCRCHQGRVHGPDVSCRSQLEGECGGPGRPCPTRRWSSLRTHGAARRSLARGKVASASASGTRRSRSLPMPQRQRCRCTAPSTGTTRHTPRDALRWPPRPGSSYASHAARYAPRNPGKGRPSAPRRVWLLLVGLLADAVVHQPPMKHAEQVL
jgi:hypothetical protein